MTLHALPGRAGRAVLGTAGGEAAAAAVIALLLLVAGSGEVPLLGRDEPRFAQAAREMLAGGELVVPTFGGRERYDKPILVYWCTAASYALFGVSERAARLPSALAGALTVALVAASARRRWGRGGGLLAGALLTASFAFHVQARACTADLVMLLPTTVAMLALERLVVGDGGWREALTLWIGLALATLAKGPIGPAVALATGIALWALGREWRRLDLALAAGLLLAGWWRLGPVVLLAPAAIAVVSALRSPAARAGLGRLRWWWGLPLAAALVLPWAVAAWVETGGAFFRVGVGRHVIERSLTALESHGGFPGFYLVTGPLAAFPWFAFLAPAVGRFRFAPEQRFLLAWLVGPLVMLELTATKLVHYWLPSHPAGVLLVVGCLMAAPAGAAAVRWPARVTLAAGGLVAAAVPLAVALRLGLDALLPVAAATALPAAALVVWAGWRAGREPLRAALAAALAGGWLLLGLVGAFLPALAPSLVGPKTAARASAARRAGEALLVFKARDDELFFYLPLGAVSCRSPECLTERLGSGEPFLGVARAADLARFRDQHPEPPVEVVEEVAGVDLGRVGWTRGVLFRPAGVAVASAP